MDGFVELILLYNRGVLISNSNFYMMKNKRPFFGVSEKFQELLQEQIKDPEFKKEWDDIQPEMDVIRAMIDARK